MLIESKFLFVIVHLRRKDGIHRGEIKHTLERMLYDTLQTSRESRRRRRKQKRKKTRKFVCSAYDEKKNTKSK